MNMTLVERALQGVWLSSWIAYAIDKPVSHIFIFENGMVKELFSGFYINCCKGKYHIDTERNTIEFAVLSSKTNLFNNDIDLGGSTIYYSYENGELRLFPINADNEVDWTKEFIKLD